MFKPITDAIRLFLTCFLLDFNPICKRVEQDGEYHQSFIMSDGKAYVVVVQRTLMVLTYRQWFIPDAVKYVYLASLIEGGEIVTDAVLYARGYPELTSSHIRRLSDPTYPFMKIANVHIEQYFGKRNDDTTNNVQ